MPIPDRPVSGELIESEWGQAVHDDTFAPKGCRVSGSSAVNISTTYAGLPMDTGDDDPGGWLDGANDRIEVPTGADGLYTLNMQYRTTTGTDGQTVLCSYAINGTPTAAAVVNCLTGQSPQVNLNGVETLSAGDIITVQGRKLASGGATPTLQLMSLTIVRIGQELGA